MRELRAVLRRAKTWAYVFLCTTLQVWTGSAAAAPPIWGQQGSPLLPAELVFADAFGHSLAVSGESVVVGVLVKQATTPPLKGAAYFFERSGRTWTQIGARRTVSESTDFGTAVAISGNTALIGADATDVGATTRQGLVHVYMRSGADWTEQTPSIVASDGANGDIFGNAVVLSGDTAVVGAPGKPITGNIQGGVYVFVRSSTGWAQQGPMLVGSDRTDFDGFGRTLALSGETLFVGAAGSSSAFVFVRSGETWTQQGDPLQAGDPNSTPGFGQDIALSGDTAVFGVSSMDVGSNVGQGAAFVFTRSGTTWTQQGGALLASDGAAGDNFGAAVGISGDVILVGAHRHAVAGNDQQGAVYVFRRSGTTWSQDTAQLLASDGASLGSFGSNIAMSDQTALIGGTASDMRSAVYPLYLGHSQGDACSGTKDCLNLTCVDQVCCDTACAGGCDVCSAALGASSDGVCSILPAGAAGSPACGELACTGQSACTPCTRDSNCTSGHFCAQTGTCQPVLPNGTNCGDLAALCADASCAPCASGHCSDGVCCDTACDGLCTSCLASKNGTGADGTCGLVAEARDPDDECAQDPDYPSSCGLDGECDGSGACRFAVQGTVCQESACEAGVQVSGACDGTGTCVTQEGAACGVVDPICRDDHTVQSGAGVRTNCAPYGCVDGRCKTKCTTANDCVKPNACNVDGECAEPKEDELEPAPQVSAGGCGCRIAGSRVPSSSKGMLVLLAIAWMWKRATRRRACRTREAVRLKRPRSHRRR